MSCHLLEIAWHHIYNNTISDQNLLSIKYDLVKRLYNKGLPKKKIELILDFIRYYVSFDKAENMRKFESLISKPKIAMGIQEAILKDVERQGREAGLIIGIKGLYLVGTDIPKIASLVNKTEQEVQDIIANLKAQGEIE